MHKVIALIGSFVVLVLVMGSKIKQQQSPLGNSFTPNQIKFQGKIAEDEALSAIGLVGKYLLLGADEGHKIQVLEPDVTNSIYRVISDIELPIKKSGSSEVDIEGIAVENNTVYVVGSHTVTKKNKGKNLKNNNRQNVFRFQLNLDSGELTSKIKRDSLKKILRQDPTLKEFLNVPNHKNGIDIEGIAVKDKYLYFGFRTPILKQIFSPVIVTKFKNLDHKNKYQLRHVNLAGNGIRDLVAVDQGFLILADTSALDDAEHYQVYFWDGQDDLKKATSTTKLLAQIPAAEKTRAEGIVLLEETDSQYLALIIYDGVAEGNPTIFTISKTKKAN